MRAILYVFFYPPGDPGKTSSSSIHFRTTFWFACVFPWGILPRQSSWSPRWSTKWLPSNTTSVGPSVRFPPL